MCNRSSIVFPIIGKQYCCSTGVRKVICTTALLANQICACFPAQSTGCSYFVKPYDWLELIGWRILFCTLLKSALMIYVCNCFYFLEELSVITNLNCLYQTSNRIVAFLVSFLNEYNWLVCFHVRRQEWTRVCGSVILLSWRIRSQFIESSGHSHLSCKLRLAKDCCLIYHTAAKSCRCSVI